MNDKAAWSSILVFETSMLCTINHYHNFKLILPGENTLQILKNETLKLSITHPLTMRYLYNDVPTAQQVEQGANTTKVTCLKTRKYTY